LGGLHRGLAKAGGAETGVPGAYRCRKGDPAPGEFQSGLIVDDIDCDGEKEFLYQAGDLNCYIHSRGASVFELDCFKNKH
jgi:hypothetical protein